MSDIDKGARYEFSQDRKGMLWDLALYIHTVGALFSIAAKMWYGANHSWAYLLVFHGTFFLLVGANRVLKTRGRGRPAAPGAGGGARGRGRGRRRGGGASERGK